MPPVNLLVTATLDQLAAAGLDMSRVRESVADRTADRTAGATSSAPASWASSTPRPPGCGPGLATLSRYGPVGGFLLGYLTCNATITRILVDDVGAPLDVGRARRLVTARQHKALAVRDGGCAWPGCACPPEGVDVHHLHEWQHGGATDLHNLGSFCGRHHQMLHLGIGEARVIDGRLHVRLPAWIDPDRRWLRNTLHQTRETAARLGQQLALALDGRADPDDPFRQPPDAQCWDRSPSAPDPPPS